MTTFGPKLKAPISAVPFSVSATGGVVLLLALIGCSVASAQEGRQAEYIRSSQPPFLTYQELVTLYEQETPDPALVQKLHTLLTTPFVNNEAYFSGVKPLQPDLDNRGPSLRVVQWNIERGLELDDIKLALTDKQGFLAKAQSEAAKSKEPDAGIDDKLSAQLDALQSADVIVLNEVDWGMKRTDYKAVIKELADALHMNWAYGVEFVEIDPKMLGLQSFANVENDTERKELEQIFSVDKSQYLGLHGSAILSRYPLRDVKLVPFQYRGLRLVQRREEVWKPRGWQA